MNRKEHLLTIIGEECAEIQKNCSKALRFGLKDKESALSETNETRILQEFNDLLAVMEMFFECPIQDMISKSEMDNKKAKVERYFKYSEEVGTLTASNPKPQECYKDGHPCDCPGLCRENC